MTVALLSLAYFVGGTVTAGMMLRHMEGPPADWDGDDKVASIGIFLFWPVFLLGLSAWWGIRQTASIPELLAARRARRDFPRARTVKVLTDREVVYPSE